MKIAFVQFEAENYAIQLFSALLKQKGHQVYLIFDPRLFNTDEVSNRRLAKLFDIKKYNLKKIKEIKPDLIGFSVYTQDYQYALSFARMIKKDIPDVLIIFGGIHCILCPEQVIKEDCVDMVCVGEGEEALLEYMDNCSPLKTGSKAFQEIDNFWFKYPHFKNRLRPLIQDLDSLPFIDRDILYEQKPVFKRDISILTGRGCPYSCTFCASDALNRQYRENNLGNPIRKRSVCNVITELKIMQIKYNPRSIYFVDDVFTLDTRWLKEFTHIYKNTIELPFYCTANPATIKDEELHLLKEAGCQMIGFGMQSCNEEYRKTSLKRYGSNDRIREVAKLCRYLKIHFSFDHILNLPNEPENNQVEAIEFYNETRPDIINTFEMTYLPKIELNKYLSTQEREEVDNGKVRTEMFNRSGNYIVSTLSLLLLLPKSWISFLNRQNLTRFIHLPYPIRLLLKDIKRLMIGRYSDVFFPIRLLLVNIKDNILIKCRLR